ncbi:probable ADP-ribosylation factor GTPase-activating protein AGD15 [Pistacia vera]|uniref:probable ADP-ribosylation factor GTPase-activating protein AGD15 n=1 Tax=Pistacia vera TaxID=55513 RepID=UPI001263D8FF|nr:probable ADP-ribosylation factor GTPase-activating protein AGD15 [Pistacia vera]
MNGKASVSKELDARHSKILEGLLKLPENRECADCKNKAPRWASVNLGVFICMQCSGIHRSLGVHISKVRSTTLDTWLPEQVAFMQSIGNEKSNKFWEAELPLNFDRSRIEKFIRTKYEEKRWAPKGEREPAAKTAETNHNINKFSEGVKGGVSRKPRVLSLEDEIFTKHMSQTTPPAMKSRRGYISKVLGVPKYSAIGNEKSNKFWEAELPPNFDRSRIEKFIRTKYEDKRWDPKGETEPAAKTAETNHNINKFPEGVKGGVSRKPRE